MTDITEGLLQHKRRAERLFGASVFLFPDMAKKDCGWLKPAMFSSDYGDFWGRILSGDEPGKAAIDSGLFEEIVKAQNEIVTGLDYMSFARTISEDNNYIRISNMLPELARELNARNLPRVSDLCSKIGDKALSQSQGDNISNAVDVGTDFCAYITNPIDSIDFGYFDLDRTTGGIGKQTMTLIAARPSMGKSAFVLDIARNNAYAGKKVLVFSIEMSKFQLWSRMVCGMANVDWRKIRKGLADDAELERLNQANTELMNTLEDRLLIDDVSRVTMDDIWQKCARIKPDLVIIDHISLVTDPTDNEILRLGKISWAGKQLAKELECAVFFCVQLSRQVEARANKRPVLSDLRFSGELEQNADQVFFIHRDDYYEDDSADVSKAEIIVAKYRDGARGGIVPLMFNKKQQRFFCEANAQKPGR